MNVACDRKRPERTERRRPSPSNCSAHRADSSRLGTRSLRLAARTAKCVYVQAHACLGSGLRARTWPGGRRLVPAHLPGQTAEVPAGNWLSQDLSSRLINHSLSSAVSAS